MGPGEQNKEEQQLVPAGVQLPAERMQSQKGLGKIDQEDKIIPRLKIAQLTNPEVEAKTAEPGDLFTQFRNYGKDVVLIPIVWWKTRILWAPRDEGGDMRCRANDALNGSVHGKCADCSKAQWTQDAPECTAIINILALLGNDPVAISFMKTSYKTGKQLINLFHYKKVDIFNFQYGLYTERVENDQGIFYETRFRDKNIAVTDDAYKLCSGVFEMFKQMGKEKVQDVAPAE